MDPFYAWIEHTALSIWIRESLSIFAFPGILTLHTLGLAFLAGTQVAIDLRLLGVAPLLPIAPLERFFVVSWWAFWVSLVTGILLVVAYPAKAFTNPLFYVKLTLIALATWTAVRVRGVLAGVAAGDVAGDALARRLAAASLLLWAGAIVSGRLLAYTYSRLLSDL
jgi:hypothetical protein